MAGIRRLGRHAASAQGETDERWRYGRDLQADGDAEGGGVRRGRWLAEKRKAEGFSSLSPTASFGWRRLGRRVIEQ